MPKTVDLRGTGVSLAHKSDWSEGILSDSIDSKSFLENLVTNNNERTGFLMCFSDFFLYDMYFFPTQSSKDLYSLLAFNESQVPL